LGNDLFSLFLDQSMTYSCAFFRTPEESLYEAQLNKVRMFIKKTQLKPTDKVKKNNKHE